MSRAETMTGDHPLRTVILTALLMGVMLFAVVGLDYLLRADTFPVRNVSFEGEFKRVHQRQLAEAVTEQASGNFFALDLEAVRRAAEAVPWVHRSTVRRRWPDGVHIHFTEQQLAARWGDTAWVNSDGELADLRGQAGPAGLIRLDGPPGSQAEVLAQWRRLEPIVAAHALGIARLRLTPRYTWEIELNNNLLLVAGRGAPERKLARFIGVYRHTVAGQAARIRHVDLRYTNGFAVEWNARAAGAPATEINEG
jgi:cell division protein FtsQ